MSNRTWCGPRVLAESSRPGHELVRELREDGYDVLFREFAGSHTVPAAVAREAFTWFLG